MATGLKVPVGVDKSGGAAVEINSTKQLVKLLKLALSESGDDNPFQTLGLRENLIFRIKDADFRGEALEAIERVFRGFSERVQLITNEPISFNDEIEGEITVNLKFIDLERDEIVDFSESFLR